jgi:hypothetical protein
VRPWLKPQDHTHAKKIKSRAITYVAEFENIAYSILLSLMSSKQLRQKHRRETNGVQVVSVVSDNSKGITLEVQANELWNIPHPL